MRSPTRRIRASPPSTSQALTGTVVQLIKRLKLVYKPAVTVRWAVRIRDAAVGDSGEYECQVTTPNTTTIIVNLNVLGKLALGCVILTSWPPSAVTEHFTQPRIYIRQDSLLIPATVMSSSLGFQNIRFLITTYRCTKWKFFRLWKRITTSYADGRQIMHEVSHLSKRLSQPSCLA